MENIRLVLVLFLMSIAVVSAGAEHAVAAGYDEEIFQGDKKELAMLKAVEDIDANMEFLLRMHKEVDAANGLGWRIFIADKIPSQPVAVIRLLARDANPDIDRMCPRIVIEDMMSDAGYDRWMERAITALDSFRMVDAREESIRKTCLENIQKSLAKSPLRQNRK